VSNTKQNLKYNDSHETRIALLEQSMVHVGETLTRIEERIEKLDDKICLRMDRLDCRKCQLMIIIIGSIVGFVAGKILHWI
jgi:hypothetical protein